MEEEVAVAVLGIVFLTIMGSVILLRPITGRLRALLKLMIEEKRMRIGPDSGGVPGAHALEHLEERLRRAEDRLEFAEGMLDRRNSLAAWHADATSRRRAGGRCAGSGGRVQDWVVEVVRELGVVGIALLMFAENLFPPLPSEVIMPLAGYLSTRQELGFWPAERKR